MSSAVYAPDQLLRVGLSTAMIEPALVHGKLDGIGIYSQALLQNLPATGCTVDGFSFPLKPVKRAHAIRVGTGGTVKAAATTKVGKMMTPYPALALRDWAFPAARSRLPIDVYHATDYRIVRMQCPVVATLHDAIALKYPQWCSPNLRGLKNWLLKKAALKADRVIALSQFAVTELVEYFGIDQRRIDVVPCGVDVEWLNAPEPQLVAQTLQQYALRSGYFLFVGTLQPRKNVARLIDAYLALPAALRRERQLVIVGRASWDCEEVRRKIQAALQNGEALVWLDRLNNNQQLRHVYAGAGVFAFPSLYEGFGIPMVEAFASGVPVVSSNASSLPEVAQGAALEVDPTDIGALTSALQMLVNDATLRARCIAAGHERARQLSWARTAEMTLAVYRRALSGG